nr:flagellar basal-body MS-ring/collar protein FliF [Buchnera aphidicola]
MISFSVFLSFIIVFFLWFNTINYVVLYNHLSDKDEFWVISQLQSMKIPYKFNNITGALLVPENKIHELRFQLLNNNLNKEKIYGFDFLNNDKFNVGQFNENLNYHRGLEGELSKTLMNIFPIKYARVHLSYQKDTNFLQKKEIPSVSIVITLYPNTCLKKNQVNSIISLITGSITNLSSDHIVIVDQNGTLLNQLFLNKKRFFNNNIQKHADFLKDYYWNRINKALKPLLGSKNFFIQITPYIMSYVKKNNMIYKNKKNKSKAVNLLNLVPDYLNNLGISKKNNSLKNISSHNISKNINDVNLIKVNKNINSKAITKNYIINKEHSGNFNTSKLIDHSQFNNNNVYMKKNHIITRDVNFYERILNNKFIHFSIKILANYKKNDLGILVPLTEKEKENIKTIIKSVVNFSHKHGDILEIINMLFFQPHKSTHMYSLFDYKNFFISYKWTFVFLFLFLFFFFVLRKIFLIYIKRNNIMKKEPLKNKDNLSTVFVTQKLCSTEVKEKNILLNSQYFFKNKKNWILILKLSQKFFGYG